MKHQPLQYFMHDGPAAFRFELLRALDGEGARRLAQDWRTASSAIGDRAWIVDVTNLDSAEDEGRALLARWHGEGAKFIAKSQVSGERAAAIIGKPVHEVASPSPTHWPGLPFRTSFSAVKLQLTLLAALLLPMQLYAATLKTETVAAWNDYIDSVRAGLQDRVRPGGNFLWIDDRPENIAKVHDGEIVVVPAASDIPRKVPGGLIHHWMGAAFVPNTKLDDILEVTRDYDRYKEFYRPFVIESKTVARSGSNDNFSMLLMNRALFLKSALDADYQATNVRLDSCRFYSVSKTTRVQEIEEYGQPGEHRIPEGEGRGYIWKLFSIARLQQRDGGVYVEVEAVGLSREIPGAVRLVVDPIVRRVSRNSMLTSIEQTEKAVRSNSLADAKPANSPASDNVNSGSTTLKNSSSAFAPAH
jgi:hypothetical protein